VKGRADIFLAKYSNSGNLLWTYRFGGRLADWGIGLLASSDGSVYCSGFFIDSISIGTNVLVPFASGTKNAFVAKFDKDGNPLWAQAGYAELDTRGISMVEDLNQNIIIGGFSNGISIFGNDTLGVTGEDRRILIKYSEDGDLLFAKESEEPGRITRLTIGSDQNLYVAGYSGRTLNARNLHFSSFDEDGTERWSILGQTALEDVVTSLDFHENGFLYGGGIFARGMNLGNLSIEDNDQSNNGFITKINQAGDVVMLKEVISGDSTFRFYDLKTFGNNILISGGFWGNIEVDGSTFSSLGSGDGFLLSLDTLGSLKWFKQFGNEPIDDCGFNCSDGIQTINLDIHKSLYVGGFYKEDIYFDSTFVNGAEGLSGFIAKFYLPIEASFENSEAQICQGDSIEFFPSGNGSMLDYEWVFEGGSPATSNELNPKVQYAQPGDYNIELRISNQFETDTIFKILNIEVVDNPFIQLPSDTTICENDSLLLMVVDTFISYNWSNGSSSSNTLIDTAGTYSLSVTNDFGCIGSDEIIISEMTCTTGVDTESSDNSIFIYPNPIADKLFIEYPYSYGLLEIYNLPGQRINAPQRLNKGKNQIVMDNWHNGLLIFKVRNENEILSSGKLLKL